MTTPLLIIGDAPSAVTGLGRICRDIASRVHANCPEYEVATFGYGGFGDKSLDFMQYSIEGMQDWFLPSLPDVWYDFAGDRHGIVMTIWDASRLLWLARPENPQYCPDGRMRQFLTNKPFDLWGYFPIDAVGPNGRMSVMQRECVLGFDRILAYTSWAERIIRNTIDADVAERTEVTAIPHGINTEIFRPKRYGRYVFHDKLQFNGPAIQPEEKIIGIVATNQMRKDWGLAIESVARVAKDVPLRLYCQIDTLERHWSLPALLMDYGLMPNAIVNLNPVTDHLMAQIYSACDLTLGIGLGEGFGYPIFESLACGTPCLTGSYGGQAEFMPKEMLMDPVAWRLEGLYDCRRPVFDSEKWAYWIQKLLRSPKTGKSLLPPELDWNNLWRNEWEPWFKSGQNRRRLEDATPAQSDSTSEMDKGILAQSKLRVADPGDPKGDSTVEAVFERDPESGDMSIQEVRER